MDAINRILAHNIQTYRKAAGLTQEQLALKCGLHRTYVGAVEQQRVNISLKNVGKIATGLQVDPALLLLDTREFKRPLAHSKSKGFHLVDKALCTWGDDGVHIHPIVDVREDLTVKILCSLAHQGYSGPDLARAYNRVFYQVIEFVDTFSEQEDT